MKFAPGDQVGFLDEALEGTVKRTDRYGLCHVEVEGGLEIEVHEKKLVLLRRGPEAEIPSSSDLATPARKLLEADNTAPFDKLAGDAFYFAACPGEDMQVMTGPVGFYLVNKLAYHVLYAVSAGLGTAHAGLAHGALAPGESRLLLLRRRDELLDWKSFVLQALFYKEGRQVLLPPLNKELPLQLPDLGVADHPLPGPWAYSKVTKLVSADLSVPDLAALRDKYAPAGTRKAEPAKPARRAAPQPEAAVLVNESEVDLHIQHLADDYLHLNNAEMLQVQMRRFRQEMDQALKHHYKKVTFIHGVGNGVLRNEILRELRTYPGVVSRDAPFEKYGYGATEVVFL